VRSLILFCVTGVVLALTPAAHAQSDGSDAHAGAEQSTAHSPHSHAPPGADAGDAHDPTVASLIERVREATAHLRDRGAAARAGYRRMGIDFPAMGEHWVNPGLLLRRELDFSAPAILTYTAIDDRATLTGVVFAIGLGPGETPPPVAGKQRPWHEHNESIADESFVQPATRPMRNDRRRLAVLHLWTEMPNPTGPFATENWALPFLRLGFAPPDPLPVNAARALALVLSGDGYFVDLVRAAAGPDALEIAQPIIADARADALAAINGLPRSEPIDANALAALESVWNRMVERIAAACADCAGVLLDRKAPASRTDHTATGNPK
jgi:hypothetical protein